MATEAGKQAKSRANRKSYEKNKLRHLAWQAAQSIALEPCEVCGKEPAHRHHPNPVDKLKVVFLCPYHHTQAHKRLSRIS